MDLALIDTDIVSEIIKGRNPRVDDAVRRHSSEHGRLTFSAISFYEVSRGFLAAGADRRLADFVRFSALSEVLPVSMAVLHRASKL